MAFLSWTLAFQMSMTWNFAASVCKALYGELVENSVDGSRFHLVTVDVRTIPEYKQRSDSYICTVWVITCLFACICKTRWVALKNFFLDKIRGVVCRAPCNLHMFNHMLNYAINSNLQDMLNQTWQKTLMPLMVWVVNSTATPLIGWLWIARVATRPSHV